MSPVKLKINGDLWLVEILSENKYNFLTKKDHESGEKTTFMVVGDQISMIKVEDERGV